jgi:hypothetical protein
MATRRRGIASISSDEMAVRWSIFAEHMLRDEGPVQDEMVAALASFKRHAGRDVQIQRAHELEEDCPEMRIAYTVQMGMDSFILALYVNPEELNFFWTWARQLAALDVKWESENKESLFRLLSDPHMGMERIFVTTKDLPMPSWATAAVPDGEWLVDPGLTVMIHEDMVKEIP